MSGSTSVTGGDVVLSNGAISGSDFTVGEVGGNLSFFGVTTTTQQIFQAPPGGTLTPAGPGEPYPNLSSTAAAVLELQNYVTAISLQLQALGLQASS